MSVTAQNGVFSFGVQSAKGTEATNFYKHRVLATDLSPIVQKDVFRPQVGDLPVPDGVYKTGAFYAGSVSMHPRLEYVYGYLLLGLMGDAETPVDGGGSRYKHVFKMKAGEEHYIPWMTFRREVPGTNSGDEFGDMGLDCKIDTAQFTIPQVGALVSDFSIKGREPRLLNSTDVGGWNYINADYENSDSVPVSMTGGIEILHASTPLSNLPIVGARISFINSTTSVQEERVVGSYHPEDFATRQRLVQIEITYKWENSDLYRMIYNNNESDTVNDADQKFAPCIEFSRFKANLTSPCEISDSITAPYEIEFEAAKVSWQPASPITLAGDNMLMQNYVGIAMAPDAGAYDSGTNHFGGDYFTISLVNSHANAYTA